MYKGLRAGSNLPTMFRDTRFVHYDTERGDPSILNQLKSWSPSLSTPSLLLHGRPGLGKTMLACATSNEMQKRNATLRKGVPLQYRPTVRQHKFPVYFVQLAELIEMHIRLFRLSEMLQKGILGDPTEYLTLDQLLEDLKYTAKLLVVDDVGKV